MSTLHVMLPSHERAGLDAGARRALARADREPDAAPGLLPMLAALFQWPGRQLPAAALMRQHAVGDAGQDAWLCAEPSWAEADINGARLMACGGLELDADEAGALAAALRPLLGDAGALLELTTPSRWHLRLPQGARLPDFQPPDRVLGDDLLPHLDGDGALRRWRRLFNEIQTELHAHPVNARRRAAGKPPVNAVWFWGGGALPGWVRTGLGAVFSDDPLATALAAQAGIAARPLADFDRAEPATGQAWLLDLGQQALQPDAWAMLLDLLGRGPFVSLELNFACGRRYRLRRWHRWRFWRRPA